METKTKHTPGPWFMQDHVHPEISVYAPKFGLVACSIYAGPTGLANAHLIAAAPEMLEALRELDPANGARTDCNERKCGACSTCRARAAIAKAEGR